MFHSHRVWADGGRSEELDSKNQTGVGPQAAAVHTSALPHTQLFCLLSDSPTTIIKVWMAEVHRCLNKREGEGGRQKYRQRQKDKERENQTDRQRARQTDRRRGMKGDGKTGGEKQRP